MDGNTKRSCDQIVEYCSYIYGNFFRLAMESSELFQWLKTIGLSDYGKSFWDAGFFDLQSVASLTETQLKEAGQIRNKKPINKLLRELGKLKSGNTESQFAETASTNITSLFDNRGSWEPLHVHCYNWPASIDLSCLA